MHVKNKALIDATGFNFSHSTTDSVDLNE